MNNDDAFTVRRLAKSFRDARFSLGQMHRALMPNRSAAWIPFDQDGLRRDMSHLCRIGMIEEAKGPRGGEGWRLTPEAVKFAASVK